MKKLYFLLLISLLGIGRLQTQTIDSMRYQLDHVPFTGTNGYSAANQLDINRWRA